MSILRRHPQPLALFLLFCLLVQFPSPLQAAEATLSEIIVTNTQDDLLVFFDIEGSFTREMEEAILNGIPAIIDIKSGGKWDWHGLQLDGYALLLKRSLIRFGLYLSKHGTYKLEPYEDSRDTDVFLGALTVANWKSERS